MECHGTGSRDLEFWQSTPLRGVQVRRGTMGQDLETWSSDRALFCQGCRFSEASLPAWSIMTGLVGMVTPCSQVANRTPYHGTEARWAMHVHRGVAAFSTRFPPWPMGGVFPSLGPTSAGSLFQPGALLGRELYLAESYIRPGALLDRKLYSAMSFTWP